MPHNYPFPDNAFNPLNGHPPPIGSLIKFSLKPNKWQGAHFRNHKTGKWVYVQNDTIVTFVGHEQDVIVRANKEVVIAKAWLFLINNEIFMTVDPGRSSQMIDYNWEYVPCE